MCRQSSRRRTMKKLIVTCAFAAIVPVFGIFAVADPPEADAFPTCGCAVNGGLCVNAIPPKLGTGEHPVEKLLGEINSCLDSFDACVDKCAEKKACKRDCKDVTKELTAACEKAFAETSCQNGDSKCKTQSRRDQRECKSEARKEKRGCKRSCGD